MKVFGRLAPGVTLPEAQAEATTLAARTAAAWPQTYAHLTPQVLPYAESVIAIPVKGRAGIYALNFLAALFLIVVCGNVALLMFARAATREKELLVRTALGATRGRIVGMLFLEALVLAIIAAALGLTAAGLLLRGAVEMMRAGPDQWPFWMDGGLSLTTVFYAGLLALAAAAVAGVVPGLKVMGKGLWDRLRQSSAGAGGLRMGGVWTGVIIAQVAATILFTALAFVVQRQAAYLASLDVGFPAEQFLSTRLELDPSPAEDATATGRQQFLQRYDATIRELARRIASESAVTGVTLAEQLPRMPPPVRRVEIEPADESANDSQSSKRPVAQTTAVALDFFDVFQMPVLAGRRFDSRDVVENANTVVVNSIFVEQALQGRNAIGRRIRLSSTRDSAGSSAPAQAGPWLEIVGVVLDAVPRAPAPLNLDNPTRPRLYRPLGATGGNPPWYLAVQVKTAVDPFVPTLRRIASELSPTLRLHDILPLDQATNEDARFWSIFAKLVLVGSALTLLLSLAGIYSVMSFTVSRRTREIGVRIALGGQATRVMLEIFHRPFGQVAAGVLVWRGTLALRGLPLPGWPWRLGLLAFTLAATWATHRTLLGQNAGVTLIVVLLSLKTLEMRARRDAFVVFFLAFFTLLTHFFYSQSLLTAAGILIALLGLLTALVNAHMPVGRPSLAQAARIAAGMAALGAPIMLVLFLLFPRLSPLWGVPSDDRGRSGLSSTMRPSAMR